MSIMKKSILLFAGLLMLIMTLQAQTVTDYDGNVYDTVTIGTQVWMKQNLRVTHYNDGTAIPNITDNTQWSNLTTGAYCDYNNTPNYSAIYGTLYNWHTVSKDNLCPTGWRVPSNADWNLMEKYLDNTVDTNAIGWVGTDIGRKLKEAGTTHWNSPNTSATNSSGFTALGGSFRYPNGSFWTLGNDGDWWTSSVYSVSESWFRHLFYSESRIGHPTLEKTYGFSIRCIQINAYSIDDFNLQEKINIYPNPAFDKVYVNVDCALTKNASLQIYNVIGECVAQQKLVSGTNEIDISNLSKGVYIIKVVDEVKFFQQKLIKE